MSRKRKKLRGRVEKVIKSAIPREPEKAQIGVDDADELYREIRVENVLTGEDGQQVRLSSPERRWTLCSKLTRTPQRKSVTSLWGRASQSAALEEEVDSLSNVRLMVRATIYLRNSECDCISAFSSASSAGTSESFALTALSQSSLIRSSRGSISTTDKR